MSIQPGVGFSFSQSSYGTTLNIDALYTDPVPVLPVDQFSVVMDGNNVFVAKGRVVAQDLTNSPVTILHEYAVKAFSVFPTGSLVSGTDNSSLWCSQGGSVGIANANDDGSNDWGVYLIRINDYTGGGYGPTQRPQLAVMADSSDAETKSKPWAGGVEREFVTIRSVQTVAIEQPSGTVSGALVLEHHCAIKRYQCQRLKVAAINWADDTEWTVTQHLIGSLYMPNNVHPACEIDYEANGPDGPNDPPDILWPLNSSENNDWFGDWYGYTKVFDANNTTIVIPV